jgi:hypothetical protein
MNESLVTPEPPDPLVEETRAFWRETGKNMVRESLGTIDETARQIIGVAGILEGLYFHAIAFSNLRGQVAGGWPLAIYLAPIVLLLVSLSAALFVFFPRLYRLNIHSSEASQMVYERVVARKLLLLKLASLGLALGVVALFLAVLTYLRG